MRKPDVSKFWLISIMPVALILFCTVVVENASGQSYDASYLYLGRYPDNGTPNWGDNDTATQGIAHDEDNWYISAASTEPFGTGDDWIIWRIPVDEPLDQDFYDSTNPEVRHVRRSDEHELDVLGFHHPGDIDCYTYHHASGSTDYLIAPMSDRVAPALVVFRADDLELVDFKYLYDDPNDPEKQDDIGWCAVSGSGVVYTSEDRLAGDLYRYDVDWPLLHDTGELDFDRLETITIWNEDGSIPVLLRDMQGGDFSENENLLFLNCGVSATWHPENGISVFETTNWRRVQKSTNPAFGEVGYFNYSFNNASIPDIDEPEGLDIWDLSEGGAPYIRGQLHVLVYTWIGVLLSNKVTLMHYDNTIHIDAGNGLATPGWEQPYPGTPLGPPISGRPFRDVEDAIDWYPIWDGAQLEFAPGSYPGNTIIDRRVKLVAPNGTAIIGQ